MARGQTWAHEEVTALLDIWSEDYINSLMSSTHKNNEVLKLFSAKMEERGFQRTVAQCRIKIKKLRQQYHKVRDSLRGSMESGEVKDKCPWYDELDAILGTRNSVNPKYVVDSLDGETNDKDESTTEGNGTPSSPEVSVWMEEGGTTTTTTSTSMNKHGTHAPRLAIPGATSRKKKRRTLDTELTLEALLKRMDDADRARQARDTAELSYLMQMQKEASEHYSTLFREQQATTQLLLQMMERLTKSLDPASVTADANRSSDTPTL
ncbi:uncharacterized protein LOC130905788 [Corythoichthys intestinalis]|uniref:uncharacterized protein LOC130905788 n=1 Tax=Corythoichthys intestinalis TaxID=161448 RepID=UPI0025A61395|nr:uncharacterized protein LOC130905788 [Corythoichthys intestinalis]